MESSTCSGAGCERSAIFTGPCYPELALSMAAEKSSLCPEGPLSEDGCPMGTHSECLWPPVYPPGHCAYLPQVPKPLPAVTLPGILAAH